ncbi:MAG: DUF4493 domain-containing protein [Bacteroidaceae bacterium]|nr:DUF4493 domain-containing protein [Bacteroidaceae bacterium]
MNISKILMLGSFAALCLTSCMNEEFPESNARQGSMSLTVDQLEPSSTRAVETANFPVLIYSLTEGKQFASYDKASLVPNKIVMPVGNYYAEAHTPGTLEKIMSAPFYSGRDEFEILQNINTVSTVVCRMANGSFTVKFTDTFAEAFSSWTVSIDDGTASAIIYTSDRDGLNPATLYMRFEENVSALNVNFVGTTINGNRITASNRLTKKQASEQYDSDSEYFSGGDAIVIIFNTVESTEGDVTGVSVNANISFEESDDSFDMEVEDNVTDDGGDEPGGSEPGGDAGSDAITLNLPEDMIVSGATDPSLGDTYIATENGIKSIKVKMSSTSEDMIASLNDLAGNYDGVDFISGAEVVGNQEMVRLFGDLGQTLAVPAEGDTEYTFPIGNFFTLLAFLPGEHTFTLTITDMQGNTKDGLLKLTVE